MIRKVSERACFVKYIIAEFLNDRSLNPFAVISIVVGIASLAILLAFYFYIVKAATFPRYKHKTETIISRKKMDAEDANALLTMADQPFHYIFRLLLGIFILSLCFAFTAYLFLRFNSSSPWLYGWAISFLNCFKYMLIFAPIVSGAWMIFNSNAIHASDSIDRAYNRIPKDIFDFEAIERSVRLVQQDPKTIKNYGIIHLIFGIALLLYQFTPHPGLPDIFDLLDRLMGLRELQPA